MNTPRRPTDKEFQQIADCISERISDYTPDLPKRYMDEYKNKWHTVVFDNFGEGTKKEKILVAINSACAIYVFRWIDAETVSATIMP
jgi:hypothetical protein